MKNTAKLWCQSMPKANAIQNKCSHIKLSTRARAIRHGKAHTNEIIKRVNREGYNEMLPYDSKSEKRAIEKFSLREK